MARAGTREVAPLRADVHEHRRGAAVSRAGIGKATVSCAGTVDMGEYPQRSGDAHTGVVKVSCGRARTRGRATAATCGCSAKHHRHDELASPQTHEIRLKGPRALWSFQVPEN